LELSKNTSTFLMAAEDGDAIADGCVLEVLSDVAGGTGEVDLTLTFRP
jgi:hypothetical protein